MRKLILVVALNIMFNLQAQDEQKVASINSEIDSLFTLTSKHIDAVDEVPEDYMGFAEVHLNEVQSNYYTVKGKKIYSERIERQQVLINSQMALESYSELLFDFLGEYDGTYTEKELFGIRVVKPSGDTVKLSVSNYLYADSEESVQDEFEKDAFFWLKPQKESLELKVAVSELEIGDVIDVLWFKSEIERFKTGLKYLEYEWITLGDEYPILNSTFSIVQDSGVYLNVATINIDEQHKAYTSNNVNGFNVQSLEIKLKDLPIDYKEPFSSSKVEMPRIKYQLVSSYTNSKKKTPKKPFVNSQLNTTEFDTSVFILEAKEAIKQTKLSSVGTKHGHKEWHNYLSNEMDSLTLQKFYYFIRSKHSDAIFDEDILDRKYFNSYFLANVLSDSLIKYNIDAQIVVLPALLDEGIHQTVSLKELNCLVKVSLSESDYFLDFSDENLPFNKVNPKFLNAQGIVYSNSNTEAFQPITMIHPFEDNRLKFTYEITPRLDSLKTHLNLKTVAQGSGKQRVDYLLSGMSLSEFDSLYYSLNHDFTAKDSLSFKHFGNEIWNEYLSMYDSLESSYMFLTEKMFLKERIDWLKVNYDLTLKDSVIFNHLKREEMAEIRKEDLNVDNYQAYSLDL